MSRHQLSNQIHVRIPLQHFPTSQQTCSESTLQEIRNTLMKMLTVLEGTPRVDQVPRIQKAVPKHPRQWNNRLDFQSAVACWHIKPGVFNSFRPMMLPPCQDCDTWTTRRSFGGKRSLEARLRWTSCWHRFYWSELMKRIAAGCTRANLKKQANQWLELMEIVDKWIKEYIDGLRSGWEKGENRVRWLAVCQIMKFLDQNLRCEKFGWEGKLSWVIPSRNAEFVRLQGSGTTAVQDQDGGD